MPLLDGWNYSMLEVTWAVLKDFATSRKLSIQYVDFDDNYHLRAFDGVFQLGMILPKSDPASDDQTDFEDNFKDDGNRKLSLSTDSENAPIQRSKTAPTGWTYHAHSFEFKTSESFIYDKQPDDSDYGFCVQKFYDADDVEITENLATECVTSVIDFEPTHDFEVISGRVYVKDEITNEDVRLWVIAVPDIPAPTGYKIMVSGLNLDFVDEYQPITTDGRVSKRMNYNATYHTNKLRFVVKHPVGKVVNLMILMEMYKA